MVKWIEKESYLSTLFDGLYVVVLVKPNDTIGYASTETLRPGAVPIGNARICWHEYFDKPYSELIDVATANGFDCILRRVNP